MSRLLFTINKIGPNAAIGTMLSCPVDIYVADTVTFSVQLFEPQMKHSFQHCSI